MKFYLNRIRLNRAGFDHAGRYWGTGAALWHAWTREDEPAVERYFRAVDRPAARETLALEFPGCGFYHL